MRPLTRIEARVLGTLMEKARTVPDSYPLTMNALLSGCNQKSSREPILQVDETQAQDAIDALKRLSLVFERSGGRVTRYEHNFERVYGVPGQSAALLGLLLLRGPQTAGELRLNAERWHRFADISSVEAFLEELQQHPSDRGGPLVAKLARAAGMREQRWTQLLCGTPDEEPAAAGASGSAERGDAEAETASLAQLQARVAGLEAQLAEMQATLASLCGELGLSRAGQAAPPGT